jgi:uncharacterized protein (TIGR03435 family)
MRIAFAAAFLPLALHVAVAQPSPRFEVVSIKPSQPGEPGGATLDASHFFCSNTNLLSLIFSVWRIPAWRLSGGPAWLQTESWDISATLPPNMPSNRQELMHQADLMVQALLADRFKLAVHRETRPLIQGAQPVYELVVAKGGVKLKPSAAARVNVKMTRGHFEFQHVSMAVFAPYLYFRQDYPLQAVDRPVIDKTGLEGFYDLTLEWTPDNGPAGSGPSIFTALEEQAGLRLEPRKSPVEFLVIDRVEKPEVN